MTERTYENNLNSLAAQVHEWAIGKGFWEAEERNFGEAIALMHSELSEALEAQRHGNPPSDHIPEFDGVTEELVDTIIRICDLAGALGVNLQDALIAKMHFNEGRPWKHGKAF